ncbi:hypothetical protein BS78_10G130000 [Paspalum vaginatum]|nr:hypothetical protein BS78_10G130000 [Paspalum vaginatum]
MASSSSSSPAPLWVILGRVALVQHDSIKDPGDLSVKLAVPPRPSIPTVPMTVHPKPDYDDTDKHPYVVAAADAGLLLHVSQWPFVGFDLDRDPPGILLVARDFVRTAVPGEARATSVIRVPDRARSHQAGISTIKNTGFKQRRRPRHPPLLPLRRRRLGPEGSELPLHVRPALDVETYPVGHKAELPRDIESRRMVRVSQGKLRFVEVARARAQRPADTLVVVWTLVFGASGVACWKQQCATSLARIWASDSYRATGLPTQVPVLALLHPSNPNVVYFFLQQHLFGVDVSQSMVVDYVRRPCRLVEVVAGHKRPPPISWRYVLPWELPCSLANGQTY